MSGSLLETPRDPPGPSPTSNLPSSETSLDPQEVTVEHGHEDAPDQQYRFRYCREERHRWKTLLPTCEPNPRVVNRYYHCGSEAWVQFSPSRQTRRIVSTTCKLRICPACRQALQRAVSDRIWWALGRIQRHEWKFITLTLKHTNAPLAQQISFLKAAFRRLRQRSIWKRNVQHGWAMLELNWNAETQQWHPHLHCIVRCNFIRQDLLSKAWAAVTHGSKIVDIRVIRNSQEAAKYVAKYIGKPPSPGILSDEQRACEYYLATKGARLLIGFGGERPSLPTKVEDDYPNDWIYESPLRAFLQRLADGDSEALRQSATIGSEPDESYYHLDPEKPP